MLVLAITTMVIGILLTMGLLKYVSFPYIWITICWLLISVFLFIKSKTPVQKSVWINLAFIVFCFGILEIYSFLSPQNLEKYYTRQEGEYSTKEYFTRNEILGYSPVKGKTVRSKKYYQDQLIYDVTYTIGKDGLRVTPPAKSSANKECIIFFGDSCTFGEGVNDAETMPYIVGKLQKNKVYNYGFHGYGPHQMLAAIENGMVTCQPKVIIYQTMTAHVARSAGYSSWDWHGPKYILQNGRLKYDGHFDDGAGIGYFGKWIYPQLNKSYFYKKFFDKDIYTISDQDIRLFLEIVDTSRHKLLEAYPNAEFHIILWNQDENDATYQKVRDGLEARSIKIHLLTNILPGFSKDRTKYEISAHDKHPNPLAHQLIAEYVVKNIIGREDSTAK